MWTVDTIDSCARGLSAGCTLIGQSGSGDFKVQGFLVCVYLQTARPSPTLRSTLSQRQLQTHLASALWLSLSTCRLLVPTAALPRPEPSSKTLSKIAPLLSPDPSSKPLQALPMPCRLSAQADRSSPREMRFVVTCTNGESARNLTRPAGNQEKDRDRSEQEEVQPSKSPPDSQSQSWNRPLSATKSGPADQAPYHRRRSGSADGCEARGLRLGHR